MQLGKATGWVLLILTLTATTNAQPKRTVIQVGTLLDGRGGMIKIVFVQSPDK